MTNLLRSKRLLAVFTVIAMVLAACGSDSSGEPSSDGDEADPDALSVVVTTTIWGDVVSNIVGDEANLEVLFPVGADPHEYQLSSAQVALMQEADLVVVNGLLLEEGILDVIEGLEEDGANVLEIAGGLDPIPFGATAHHDDHEDEGDHDDEEEGDHEDEDHEGEGEEGDHDREEDEMDESCDPGAGHDLDEEEGDHDDEGDAHDDGSCDPHVWMDPLRVANAVELIAEELEALDSSVDWMANATAYAEELRSLDEEIIDELSAIAEDRRKMVTNHESFGYFADRYEFEIVGTVVPGGSTLADPSSAELAELVEVMTGEDINIIFAETVEPAALADAVAAEVGEDVEVVSLYTGSVGGPGSDAETYVDMLRSNAEAIAAALS